MNKKERQQRATDASIERWRLYKEEIRTRKPINKSFTGKCPYCEIYLEEGQTCCKREEIINFLKDKCVICGHNIDTGNLELNIKNHSIRGNWCGHCNAEARGKTLIYNI
jgi:hypothetical protein